MPRIGGQTGLVIVVYNALPPVIVSVITAAVNVAPAGDDGFY